MKNHLSDRDILNLLESLKNAENAYPQHMIQSRRSLYLRQAAAMTAMTSTAGNGPAAPSAGGFSIGTLLETALIIALVIEAAVATYIYRDRIADFIERTLAPQVEVVDSPPDILPSDVPPGAQVSTETPDGDVTVTPTVTVTVTGTPPALQSPLPPAAGGPNDNDAGNSVQAVSTPQPTNDNPGLHLGQTKQPTQDPGAGNKKDGDGAPGNKDKNNTDSTDKGRK